GIAAEKMAADDPNRSFM
ncbi:hypothetical protein A2U01_0072209, partial [Trifolium medium]|nr:hypothetical protein [Trifolium medium]